MVIWHEFCNERCKKQEMIKLFDEQTEKKPITLNMNLKFKIIKSRIINDIPREPYNSSGSTKPPVFMTYDKIT